MNQPREGMMAVVRNRRALVTGVQPFDTQVEVEYTDGLGAETDQLLWEIELGAEVLEPSALPKVDSTSPMEPREFDAMVRAARWSALTPSLPFSGLAEDKPPLAAPLYGAIQPEAYQLVPVLRALEMPRVALMLADAVGLGKTVQAGLVLREPMLRRRIRRILVLCPASLRWREEMVGPGVRTATMHRLKGTEFKRVLLSTTARCPCRRRWRASRTRPPRRICSFKSVACCTSQRRGRGMNWW